jgi:hypothetical protein
LGDAEDANEIGFDNSNSGLDSNNVQGAIDELANNPFAQYTVSSTNSIQDAIDAAVAAGHGVGNPAIVFPEPGSYNEDLTVYPFIHIAGTDDSRYLVNITGSITYQTNSGSVAANQISISNLTINSRSGQTDPVVDVSGTSPNKMFFKNVSINGGNLDGVPTVKAVCQPTSELYLRDSHVYGPTGAGAQPTDAIVNVEGPSLAIVRTNVDSYGARAVYYDPQQTWGGWLEKAVLDLRGAPTFTGGFLKVNGSDTGWGRLVDIYDGRIGSAPDSNYCTEPAIEVTGMLNFDIWGPAIRSENDPSIIFTDTGDPMIINHSWIIYGETHSGGGVQPAGGNLTVNELLMDGAVKLIPNSSGDWSGSTPVTMTEAINRIAAVVAAQHGPIA